MADSKVTIQFDIDKYVDQFIDKSTADKMGKAVINGMRKAIASGFSPVRGAGRYEKYSKSYTEAIQKGAYEGKTVRPVNLRLTGEMLDELDHNYVGGDKIEVGFLVPSEKTDIASYHNDGTDKMPKRQIIPNEGEEYTVSIMQAIKDVYSERISAIIKRSNSK